MTKAPRRKSPSEPAAAPAVDNTNPAPEPDAFAGYDVLLINSLIRDRLFNEVVACVSKNRKGDKVVLCLTTYGGLANPAYRIGRFLQTTYEEVVVFAPSFCKSAGTLIVTAANRVLMSRWARSAP